LQILERDAGKQNKNEKLYIRQQSSVCTEIQQGTVGTAVQQGTVGTAIQQGTVGTAIQFDGFPGN
jgi:hypothetical protein